MDDAVRAYIDAITPERRPLFDRIHRLILEVHPNAAVMLSYQMPTYEVGRCRLYVGVWKHGLSFYGWEHGGDTGFTGRHPDLVTSKGTIRLRPRTPSAFPTTSSASWYVPLSTADQAEIRHQLTVGTSGSALDLPNDR